jgi:aryl-alcohol dehydrogenase-like predicted oxidoreductase
MSRLIASDAPGTRRWVRDQLSARNLGIADVVRKAAVELDTTPAAVAIAWVLARPDVTGVVVGPRTLAQYEQNLAGFTLRLPPEWSARLDEVSGPAPLPVTGANSRPWLTSR